MSVIPDLIGDIPVVTYTRGESIDSLLERLRAVAPKQEERFLTGNLVKSGDCVLLVMPQDSEAPKGRLILPQVQVLRELLDRGCNAICCTPESLASALKRVTPDLVITDSQVFGLVNRALPSSIPLTSFSVLLAGAKGDLRTFVDGASAIDRLQPGDRLLIAEACTHVPDTEDIGRVKIPALLRKKADIKVDIAAGNDFPEDLTPYQLIIHCGGCVATRTLVQSRIKKALRAGVPITNYGIAIAKLQGILERIALP
jgi:[FeFe] hydrogenase H-cluster maturation GTPase HydF